MTSDADATDQSADHAATLPVDQPLEPAPLDLPDADPQWPGDPDRLPATDEPAIADREELAPDSLPSSHHESSTG